MSIIISDPKPSDFLTPPNPLYGKLSADRSDFSVKSAIEDTPSPVSFDLTIPDYTILPEFKDHINFKISAVIEGDEFLQLTGFTNGDTATPGALTVTMTYFNFQQLAFGNYKCRINFMISAQNPSGKTDLVDIITIEPDLGVDGQSFSFTPSEITAVHQKDGTPSWSGSVDIVCPGDWSLLNSDEENMGVIKINGSQAQHQEFHGNQTLTLTLSDDVNNLEIGIYRFRIWFYAPSTQGALTVWLAVKADSNDLSIVPDELHFTMIKGQDQPEAQTVFVHSIHQLNNHGLSFLFDMEYQYIQNPGDNFYAFYIKPKPSENFEEGNYTGFLMLDIDGEDHEIMLYLTVLADYDKEYDKDVHFTRDNEILKFYSSTDEDSYIRLSAEVKLYDNTGTVQTYQRQWSLAFLEGVAEINLGRELDDYLKLIQKPEDAFINSSQLKMLYKPLSIRITAREIFYEDESIANMFMVPFQYFLKGRKPLGHNWLCHYPDDVVRVTKNSMIQLNVFKPTGLPQPISCKRNGELIATYNPVPADAYHSPRFMKRTFQFKSLADLEAGEKISFSYGTKTRTYAVIPPGLNSINIGWVNQFEVLETFEFIGAVGLPMEYNETFSTVYVDWVDLLRKITSGKIQKFSVNTGWIFRANVRIIDELLSSDRAFLILPNPGMEGNQYAETHLKMVPLAKKMTAYDSEQALYAFDVEFQINRRYEDFIHLL